MSTTVTLPVDEDVIAHVQYLPHSKAEPFAVTITTKAVILLRKKSFAVRDPYFHERIDLPEIRSIHVKRLRATWCYVLAGLLVLVGAYTTWGMFTEAYRDNGGRPSGWPIATLVGGLLLPFAARGRFAMVLSRQNAAFTWKPAFVIGAAAKRKQEQILSTIVWAARAVGVLVRDDRNAPF